MKQIARSGPNWVDTIDLDDWKIPAHSVVPPQKARIDYMYCYQTRHAKLLPESVPGPHDWFRPRVRLWFCTLNGIQFAVVDENPDMALAAIDEAISTAKSPK